MRLAAGGKRIRTPGPTCGFGSLWANGTKITEFANGSSVSSASAARSASCSVSIPPVGYPARFLSVVPFPRGQAPGSADKEIADRAGLDRRQKFVALRHLERAGLVEVRRAGR